MEDVRQAREQFVSRAVTAPPLVVVGAEGARIEADDGRSYLDFAGGIGCQAAELDCIRDVRGLGPMQAIELATGLDSLEASIREVAAL